MTREVEMHENVFDVLWKGKWLIVVVTSIFALSSVFIALSIPDTYKAEVLLAPAESDSNSGLAGLASKFGGLAGLAGISMPSGQTNKVGEALALLTSRAFIQDFIAQRKLLPELLAAKELDKQTGQLVLDVEVYDQKSSTWTRSAPKGKEVIPTPWEGFAQLIQQLEVSDMSKDGTLKITLESMSPVLAKQWLEWLVADLNAHIAEQELSEAKRSIVYLRKQIENTQVQELHTIFYSLIEEQTKKIMLGEVREDYVFKVLAFPVLPEEKSAPSRMLICIAITFLGGLLSMLLVILLHLFRRG